MRRHVDKSAETNYDAALCSRAERERGLAEVQAEKIQALGSEARR